MIITNQLLIRHWLMIINSNCCWILFWPVFTFYVLFYLLFRYAAFLDYLDRVKAESSLESFTTAYKTFGIHFNDDGSVYCLEWAPGAKQLYLAGDFSEYLTYTYHRLTYIIFQIHNINRGSLVIDVGKVDLFCDRTRSFDSVLSFTRSGRSSGLSFVVPLSGPLFCMGHRFVKIFNINTDKYIPN